MKNNTIYKGKTYLTFRLNNAPQNHISGVAENKVILNLGPIKLVSMVKIDKHPDSFYPEYDLDKIKLFEEHGIKIKTIWYSPNTMKNVKSEDGLIYPDITKEKELFIVYHDCYTKNNKWLGDIPYCWELIKLGCVVHEDVDIVISSEHQAAIVLLPIKVEIFKIGDYMFDKDNPYTTIKIKTLEDALTSAKNYFEYINKN